MPASREQMLVISEWAKQQTDNPGAQFILDRSAPSQNGDCWDWLGYRRPNGYGRVSVSGRQLYAHRFAFLAFKGYLPPSSLDICHRCDNRQCVNPEHLFVGTRTDNMRDAQQKGRLSTGAKHGATVSSGKQRSRNGIGK